MFRPVVRLLVALTLLLTAATAPRVSAHATLESTSPPTDSLLTVPPERLELRFTEPVDPAAVGISAVDESGAPIAVTNVTVDPENARLVTASVSGIGFGTVTVTWQTRSATDGHELTGTYAFRVGGSDRAPAAATVEGERPASWNVLTRWLTFLGLAVTAGGLLIPASPRRRQVVLVAAGIALLATLAEPVLLSLSPPEGWSSPSIEGAVRAQPTGWWLRLIGAALALLLIALSNRLPRRVSLGGIAALAGILGLALTTHPAGREEWREAALASAVAHEWSVALWIGGLLLLLADMSSDSGVAVRGFSRRALPLGLLAVITGFINAGFISLDLDLLSASEYGLVLLVKVAIVAAVLILGALHWFRLRRQSEPLRATLTAEGGLAAVVLVIASTLALLAPPAPARGTETQIDLSLPVTATLYDEQPFVRLAVEPLKDDRKRLTVSMTERTPVTIELTQAGTERIEAPLLPDLQLVRVTLTSLSTDLAPISLSLAPVGDGTFVSEGLTLSVDGWWEAEVTVRRAGLEDATVTFYLLEPDPNVVGFNNMPEPESDPTAEELYARARQAFAARTSMVNHESLNGGTGGVEVLETTYSASGVGGEPTVQLQSDDVTIIRSGGQRQMKQGDEPWRTTGDSPVTGPADWLADYDGATQFRHFGTEEIDGRIHDRISFFVPGSNVAAAWYTWWIDRETGEVRREAMISRGHYMVKNYTSINEPVTFEATT